MQTHLDYLKHVTRFVISVALIPVVGNLMFRKYVVQRNTSFKNLRVGATTYFESINVRVLETIP